jgi:hypothetical protein
MYGERRRRGEGRRWEGKETQRPRPKRRFILPFLFF